MVSVAEAREQERRREAETMGAQRQFGVDRKDFEEARGQVGIHDMAARKGAAAFGGDRQNYQLQGLGGLQRAGEAGQMAQGSLLGDMAMRGQRGYGLGSSMMRQGANEAAALAQSQALTADGLNPAQAALLAQQGGQRALMSGAAQAAQMAAREQQFADQIRAQIAEQMAARGLGASQIQLGANQAFDQQQLAAAQAYMNPTAQELSAEQDRKARRDQAIVGGLFGAGGAALGGWLGG